MRGRPNPSGCAVGARRASVNLSLHTAGAVLMLASAAVAQPFQPGQTTSTRVNWAGVTIPGQAPSQSLTDYQPVDPSSLTPASYGFSRVINGGLFTFSGTGSAISSPAGGTNEPGITLRSQSAVAITNATVAGTSFGSNAQSVFADALGVAEIRERLLTTVTVRLNFTLRGVLTREDASGRWTSRVSLNETDFAGGSARPVYADTLGLAPQLLGQQLSPAVPTETSRTVDISFPLEFQVTVGGPLRETALALTTFAGFAPGATTGLSGSASTDFFTTGGGLSRGLRLDSIQLVEADGEIVPSHLITFASLRGLDYSELIVPGPGAVAVVVLGGVCVSVRRRRPG